VHYRGILKFDGAASKVLGWAPDAKTTQYADHDWFTGPIIETDDEAYKWVETSMFVAQGRFVVDDGGSAVEYQIYRLTS